MTDSASKEAVEPRRLSTCPYEREQAIYVWNGADPKYLDLFQRDFKAERIELTENFRCARAVVDAARRLDSSYAVDGQPPIEGAVELIECEDEASEAQAVIEKIRSLESEGHPDIEGDITPDRCAVLGRNRFVFGSLQEELKKQGIQFYKKLSAAIYQSESDVVEQFELALRLLANPRDRLHLEVLAKAWGTHGLAEDAPTSRDADDPLPFLKALANDAQRGCASTVISAITAPKWTGDDFRFLSALKKIEEYANTLPEQDRALVLQDTTEWKKHWDYYVRSEQGRRPQHHIVPGTSGLGNDPTTRRRRFSVTHGAFGKGDGIRRGVSDGNEPGNIP